MVFTPDTVHPLGEADRVDNSSLSKAIEVETFAGKVHVEWDSTAAVTPIGQLPFLSSFSNWGTASIPGWKTVHSTKQAIMPRRKLMCWALCFCPYYRVTIATPISRH
jgi:hypothetical protein